MIHEVWMESHKAFVAAKAGRAGVTIEAEDGITYARAYQRIIFPMIALLSIALMRECKVFAVEAVPMGTNDDWTRSIFFDPSDGHDLEDARFGGAIFVATDVDAGALLTGWLRLAPNNLRALESAMDKDAPGRLFPDAFDAVSAAEGLDRYLQREMKQVGQAFTRSNTSLKRRLAGLVHDLGEAVATRHLEVQSRDDWAYVAATYRDALGHGLRLQEDLQLDPGLSIAVMKSTGAVLRSTMLLASGMTEAALLNMVREEFARRTTSHHEGFDWGEMRRRSAGDPSRSELRACSAAPTAFES